MSEREKLERELGTGPPKESSTITRNRSRTRERLQQSQQHEFAHNAAGNGMRRKSSRLKRKQGNEPMYPEDYDSSTRYPTKQDSDIDLTQTEKPNPKKTTSVSKAKFYLTSTLSTATAPIAEDEPVQNLDDDNAFQTPRQTNRKHRRAAVSSVLQPPQQPTTRVPVVPPVLRSKPRPVPRTTLSPRQSSKEVDEVDNREFNEPDIMNAEESTKRKNATAAKSQDTDAIDVDEPAQQQAVPKRKNKPGGTYFNTDNFKAKVKSTKKRLEKKNVKLPPQEEEQILDGQDGDEVLEELEDVKMNGNESEVQFVSQTGGEEQPKKKIRRNDEPVIRRKAKSEGSLHLLRDKVTELKEDEEKVRKGNPKEVEHDFSHIKKCFEQHIIQVCGIVMLPDNGIDTSILRKCIVSLLNNLKLLQTIVLTRNCIQKIPDEFRTSCERIKTLDLGNNGLLFLPPWTFEACAKTLKQLHLPHNNLRCLPDGIESMDYLEVLDLSYNYLTELGGGLGSLKRLTILNLRCNYLRKLPADLGHGNKNLMSMDISENINFATGLPLSMEGCLYKLKTFWFRKTKLHDAIPKKKHYQQPTRNVILYLISLNADQVDEMYREKEEQRQRRESLKK